MTDEQKCAETFSKMRSILRSKIFHAKVHSRRCLQVICIKLRVNRVRASLIGFILCVLFIFFFVLSSRHGVHPRFSESPTSYHGNLQFDCNTINEKYPLPSEAKLVSTNYGFQMYVYKSNDIVSDRIIKNGVWEDVYVNLPNESPVLDIGGHVCWWTLTWANLGHKVFTFEPLMKNAVFCMHSICRNDFQDHVRIWNVGLGEEEQQCSLYSDPFNKGDTITVCGEDERHKHYIERQKFQIMRLDSLIEDGIFQFVKMDTEGYILPIVNGGRRVLGNTMEGKIEIWNPNDIDKILKMVPWTRLEMKNGWFLILKWLWIKYIKGSCNEDFWFSGFE